MSKDLSDKKICILYTGGTIGMVPTDDGFAPKAGYLESELRQMKDLSSNLMPSWELVEFDPLLDSTNMEHIHWNQIAEAIGERYYDYDGFVVIHGTDTMAYTASALSFMLEGLEKPVVLTGSQVPSLAVEAVIGVMAVLSAAYAKRIWNQGRIESVLENGDFM